MLANTDMHKEIAVVDDLMIREGEPTIRAVLKMLTLMVKLLHDIRTNQTLHMEHLGIELRKPKVKPVVSTTK